MTDLLVAVNVALTVLWTEPEIKREHDSLICSAAPDAAAWADGMDGDMRLWLVGKVETQALYGERLVVLDRRDGWLKVAAVSQATSHDSRGYNGWIPAAQAASDPRFLDDRLNRPSVTVTAQKTWLYQDPAGKTPLLQLSYQTTLPLLALQASMVTVRRPDGGTGYIAGGDVIRSSEITCVPENLVEEARRFIGLRYIWGGTSAYGFDCSGFAMRIYQSQGLTIPRDADEQCLGGTPVWEEELQPGDLVFFATNKGLGEIHHVGIYSGNGMMIHSPNSQAAVTEEPYDAGSYGEEYWGARRYARPASR